MNVNHLGRMGLITIFGLIFSSVTIASDEIPRAEKLIQKGKTPEARDLIAKFLAENDGPQAYVKVGSLYARLKNWKESVHYLEIASTRAPKNADIYFRLGIAYHQNSKVDDAVTSFRKALAKNPKVLKNILAVGEVLEMSDALTDARQVYEEGLKRVGENIVLRSKICLLAYKESLWSEAILNCGKVIEADQQNVTAWTLLAMSYYYSEDRVKAFAEFKSAVKLHPRANILRRARGYVFFQEKSYEQAAYELGIASSVDPLDDESIILLARSLYELHRYDDARIAYSLACLLDSTFRFEFISKQRDLERKQKLDDASKYEDTINKL